MNKIAVIGGGMIGSLIFEELSSNHDCTLFDIEAKQNSSAQILNVLTDDLSCLLPFDMLVLAIPGEKAYEALERLIILQKKIVDISFFPESSKGLDKLCKEQGVSMFYDCGVAPGFDNYALGHFNTLFKIDSFKCMVGGLPLKKNPPFNYKAPFSPSDVIEEYTRPARLRKANEEITLEALSELEVINDEHYGQLEAFNTDGLRSLLDSFPDIADMSEKTIRYEGHAQQMSFLKEAGFFNAEYLKDTSSLLFKAWKLEPEDLDFTLMYIDIKGPSKEIKIRLSSEHNGQWSSMAQSTAYNCTAAVEYLLKNPKSLSGCFPPEVLGADPSFWNFLLNYLSEKGIQIAIKED